MSLPSQKKTALKNTKDFLVHLLDDRSRWTKREIRERASRCLHHYPFDSDIEKMECDDEAIS